MSFENFDLLRSLGFVMVLGGVAQVGTSHSLKCKLEGRRKNEVYVGNQNIDGFWMARCCVANIEYEEFDKQHNRPPTSPNNMSPVTDVTYLDAVRFVQWFSKKHGITFDLPTEIEWLLAASPFGWEFPYQKHVIPNASKANTYNKDFYRTLDVDDQSLGSNHLGILHIGGNVQEITKGWYYAEGHYGFSTDGAYYIFRGGDFGHCPFSAGVHRRGIMDVSNRSTRIGFRLIHHPDKTN